MRNKKVAAGDAMSHVDEGRLAAYLDTAQAGGAAEAAAIENHVAACSECRERLERLRLEGDRARALLRSPIPSAMPQPSFAELKERAAARSAHRADARRLSRLTSLAWAASVLLAVAVGWYAGRASLRTPETPQTAPLRREIAAPVPPAELSSPAAQPSAGAVVDRPSAPEAAREAARSAREQTRSPQLAEGRGAPAAAAVPRPAPPTPITEPAPSGEEPPPRKEPLVTGQLAEQKPAEALESERMRAAGPPAGAAAVPAPARRESFSEWSDVTAAAATQALGRAPFRIPGLLVESYAVRTAGSPGGAVRVTQVLGDGRVVELVEVRTQQSDATNRLAGARAATPSPAGAPGAPAQVARPGLSRGRSVRRGDYTITATGPLSGDSLQVLLSKLQ